MQVLKAAWCCNQGNLRGIVLTKYRRRIILEDDWNNLRLALTFGKKKKTNKKPRDIIRPMCKAISLSIFIVSDYVRHYGLVLYLCAKRC